MQDSTCYGVSISVLQVLHHPEHCHNRIRVHIEKELHERCHQIFRFYSLTMCLSLQANKADNFQGVPQVTEINQRELH